MIIGKGHTEMTKLLKSKDYFLGSFVDYNFFSEGRLQFSFEDYIEA